MEEILEKFRKNYEALIDKVHIYVFKKILNFELIFEKY